MHKAKRITAGEYLYRGLTIKCIGYYPPDRRTVWEAQDDTGAWAHGYSLHEVKERIDEELDNCQ